MIPLVEEQLEIVLRKKLKELKSNVDIIDRIFPTASQTNKAKLKHYFENEKISVVRGFPRSQNQVPAFVILLGSESEVSDSLGDYVDEIEHFEENNISETLKVMRKDGKRYVKTSKRPLENINFISVDGNSYIDGFAIEDARQGILKLSEELPHVDEIEVDYDYKATGYEAYGTQFHAQYRIETWSENGDLTVYLYHLLKHMMLQSRYELESRGVMLQKLSGADFEPLPEYFPAFVYRRALLFETTYFADFEVSFPYISEINVEERE